MAELTRSPPAHWLQSECRGVAELTHSPPAWRLLPVVEDLLLKALLVRADGSTQGVPRSIWKWFRVLGQMRRHACLLGPSMELGSLGPWGRWVPH